MIKPRRSTERDQLTSFNIKHQQREHDNLESKGEHQLEIINKEIHEIFTNFQYLYLEKVLSNQPCE